MSCDRIIWSQLYSCVNARARMTIMTFYNSHSDAPRTIIMTFIDSHSDAQAAFRMTTMNRHFGHSDTRTSRRDCLNRLS